MAIPPAAVWADDLAGLRFRQGGVGKPALPPEHSRKTGCLKTMGFARDYTRQAGKSLFESERWEVEISDINGVKTFADSAADLKFRALG